jgi:glucose/arabinose dehydrogenase
MKRVVTYKLTTGLLCLASVALAWQVKNPKLPEPFHTPSANNGPRVITQPDGTQLRLPQGFSIDVYAEGFERPRFMLQGPGGEILLSDSKENGSVYALDTNKDFKVDSKKRSSKALIVHTELAFWKDYLYVAETTSLKRYNIDAEHVQVDGKGKSSFH